MIVRPNAVLDPGGLFNLLQALVYRVLGNPGLAASAGTPTQPKTANSVSYAAATNGGQAAVVLATKAGTDPLPTLAALTALSATQSCRVRIEIDSAGTVTYKQGPITSTLGAAAIPRRTQGLATLGWIEITNVTGGFTFGTTSFASTGVTFYNGDPDLGGDEGVPPNDRGLSSTVVSAP